MEKKMAALAVVYMFMISVLSGCNGNRVMNYESADKDITTLTFFGFKYEPENVMVIEQIISGFMKENPEIRVSYESLKGTDYFDALEKRMDSGKGNDVFMVNHDIMLELVQKGQVADLSGLGTISSFSSQMRSQMEENGGIYWVPTTVSAFGLYCNLNLLNAHQQKVPENLGEWDAVCSYFKSRGITPIIANDDISLKTMAIGRGFYSAYQEGVQGEVFGRLSRGEQALSEYLRSGFSIAEQFLAKGYIDGEKSLNTKKTSDDLQEFIKGESPFMLTGAWAAGRVKKMNPGFDFEVVPLPILNDGSLLVINPDTKLSVNADTAHHDAAVKFVEYFTRSENIQKFADQQSSFSPLQRADTSVMKEIRPLLSCYESGRTVIGADSLIDIPIWDLTAEASKKILADEPLESVMDWIDRQAEEDYIS